MDGEGFVLRWAGDVGEVGGVDLLGPDPTEKDGVLGIFDSGAEDDGGGISTSGESHLVSDAFRGSRERCGVEGWAYEYDASGSSLWTDGDLAGV